MSDMSKTGARSGLWGRLLWLVVLALLMGAAQTLLNIVALVQFIIMATSRGEGNAELKRFGGQIGQWMAKAARHQSGESDEKPWPWSPLG